jgi:hypothetical protein
MPIGEELDDLAEAESQHVQLAKRIEKNRVESGARGEEDEAARRTFVLGYYQGVIDGIAGSRTENTVRCY